MGRLWSRFLLTLGIHRLLLRRRKISRLRRIWRILISWKRLGNGRRARRLGFLFIAIPIWGSRGHGRAPLDDRPAYANRPQSGGLFIIIGNDLFKAYVMRTHARARARETAYLYRRTRIADLRAIFAKPTPACRCVRSLSAVETQNNLLTHQKKHRRDSSLLLFRCVLFFSLFYRLKRFRKLWLCFDKQILVLKLNLSIVIVRILSTLKTDTFFQ